MNLGIQDFKAAPLWVSADVVSLRVFLHLPPFFLTKSGRKRCLLGNAISELKQPQRENNKKQQIKLKKQNSKRPADFAAVIARL